PLRARVIHRERALAHLPAELVEQDVHRFGLQQAALDVEHDVVPLGSVQADRGRLVRDREFHLVAISIELRSRQNRPQLEGAHATEALQTVANLLFLERELRWIGEMLQTAATTLPEVRAGWLHAVRRGDEDLLDRRAGEAAARFDQSDAHAVARQS